MLEDRGARVEVRSAGFGHAWPPGEVELTPAEMARGHDAQLMKGVEVLLEKIEQDPRPPVAHPGLDPAEGGPRQRPREDEGGVEDRVERLGEELGEGLVITDQGVIDVADQQPLPIHKQTGRLCRDLDRLRLGTWKNWLP